MTENEVKERTDFWTLKALILAVILILVLFFLILRLAVVFDLPLKALLVLYPMAFFTLCFHLCLREGTLPDPYRFFQFGWGKIIWPAEYLASLTEKIAPIPYGASHFHFRQALIYLPAVAIFTALILRLVGVAWSWPLLLLILFSLSGGYFIKPIYSHLMFFLARAWEVIFG